ncbi:hypothetical protein [Sphingomonas sp. OTU376]|uniref:hypothetical protein n=1 Tax=Sphingomonas sp. OTU376 TaxID=3043863 RepID=UPI00313D1E12
MILVPVPTTIRGLKKLAKRIKRENGIQHARALDAAARVAGCEDYAHALQELPA